jgi:hypothetical protein
MSPFVDQKLISNEIRQQVLPEKSKTSTEDLKSSGSNNKFDVSKFIRELPRIVHIFAFDGDYPRQALRLDLAYRIDRLILEYLWDRYSVCQFKNTVAYNKGRRLVGQHNKGRRLVGQHNKGVVIRIGRFQGLVEPLGYQPLPLSESVKESIRTEYRIKNYSVSKLSDDWDVSVSHIREILKGDKPPVSPSADPVKQVFSEGEPPVPCRVGAGRGGYGE